MALSIEVLVAEIQALSDVQKLDLVNAILAGLDKPDPRIDRIWADEARKRWSAYKAGGIQAVPYDRVMAKHKRA